MPSVETRPYLTCANDAVRPEGWTHERGGLPAGLPQQLVDWDPAQSITAKRNLTVQIDRLKRECGLGPDAEIALVASWRSPGSGQRGLSVKKVLGRAGAEVACSIEAILPGAELAGSVRLITRIVLHRAGTEDGPLVAKRSGAILWEEQVTLVLEGIGSRFPMEVIDFPSIGLPTNAAWRLHWTKGNFNAQAMGCLRLLLNRKHKRITLAATRIAPDLEAKAIWSTIHLGVAREIITGVLADETFMMADQKFDDGSVGSVALELIQRAFPGASLQSVKERLQGSPDRFECDLQAAFNLFDPTG